MNRKGNKWNYFQFLPVQYPDRWKMVLLFLLILTCIPAKANTIFNWQTESTTGYARCPQASCPDREYLLPIVSYIVVSDEASNNGIAQLDDILSFVFRGGDVHYLLSQLDGYGHKIIFSQDGLSIERFESMIEIEPMGYLKMNRWQFRHSITAYDFGAYMQNNSIKHGLMFRDSIYDSSATAQGNWLGSDYSNPTTIMAPIFLLLRN